MKRRGVSKGWLLFAALCLLCAALSGCRANLENGNQSPTATYGRYTQKVDTATPTIDAATPTPSADIQSWDQQPATHSVVPQTTIGIATIPGTVTTPGADESNAPDSGGVLKLGSQGDAVKNVQAALKRLGYFEGKTDGDFGEYTENAVKTFQKQNGLTADGVVGEKTLAKLSSSGAATAPPATKQPSAATATPRRATATPKTSNVYLSNGSSGSNVTQMQNRLIELGYLLGSASGKVCDITEEAIIAFQQRNGLGDDGVAGPSTLQKLYSSSARNANSAVGVIGITLEKGSEGDAVRLLQSKLKSYGFLSGAADGSFGSATEDAVRAFQKANGLTSDGRAGSGTLQKLFAGSVVSSSQFNASQATATPKPGQATGRPTPTPNAYVRVTANPDGSYVTLEKGTMGSLVEKLQRALKNAGYYSGDVDGYYGDGTVEAVKRFQQAKGLSQDGKAGPATQRYLYEGDFPDKS